MTSGISLPCDNLPFVDANIRQKHFSVSVHTDITMAAGLNKFLLSFKVKKADSHLCSREPTASRQTRQVVFFKII